MSDDLLKVDGVTTAMLVAFGENDIKTLDDLADCATDDLTGWTERRKEKDAEPIRHKGVLDGFEVGRKEAEDMIMAARLILGWISPEDLEPAEEEDVEDPESTENAEADTASASAEG